MNLYLVTSKLTYSRLIVAAETPEKALRTHPDKKSHWDEPLERWAHYPGRKGPGGGYGLPATQTPTLPEWPDHIDDIEAMLIGRADRVVAQGPWAFEKSTEKRIA